MHNSKRTLLLAASAALLGAATGARAHTAAKAHPQQAGPVTGEQQDWGIAGDARAARRTVEVSMLDSMRFVPDRLDVRLGETVRFVHHNTGKLLHEFVIGTPAANKEHAALMAKFPGMQHDAAYMAHVAPGKRGEVVWTFNRPGEFQFACLIAGHYQAGMVGTITVRQA